MNKNYVVIVHDEKGIKKMQFVKANCKRKAVELFLKFNGKEDLQGCKIECLER